MDMRPLALRPQLTPGLPFSVGLRKGDRAAGAARRGRLAELDTCSRNPHDSPGLLRVAGARIDISAEMSLEPSFEEQEMLADSLERVGSRMTRREVTAGAFLAAVFAAAVLGVWLLSPPHALAILPGVVCVAVLVLAMFVSFDTPFGCTRATQLGFVPLLFAMPLAIVPLAVALALAISALPAVRAGELRPSRLLQRRATPCSSIGPVAGACARACRAGARQRRAPARGASGTVRGDFVVSSFRFLVVVAQESLVGLRSTWVYGSTRRSPASRWSSPRTSTGRRWPPWRWCRCSAARCVRTGAPPAPAEHARALERLSRHRARPRRRDRGRRRLHRRALQERRQPRARPRGAPRARAPSASATSSSPPCSTTSARSRFPRRSSTSPASSTPTSGRSSRPTRSRARRCSTASAASCARSE